MLPCPRRGYDEIADISACAVPGARIREERDCGRALPGQERMSAPLVSLTACGQGSGKHGGGDKCPIHTHNILHGAVGALRLPKASAVGRTEHTIAQTARSVEPLGGMCAKFYTRNSPSITISAPCI